MTNTSTPPNYIICELWSAIGRPTMISWPESRSIQFATVGISPPVDNQSQIAMNYFLCSLILILIRHNLIIRNALESRCSLSESWGKIGLLILLICFCCLVLEIRFGLIRVSVNVEWLKLLKDLSDEWIVKFWKLRINSFDEDIIFLFKLWTVMSKSPFESSCIVYRLLII